jgi:uncharacterized small protein (DUF1192 family)
MEDFKKEIATLKAEILRLENELHLAHERLQSSQGELGKELERLRAEMESRTKKF